MNDTRVQAFGDTAGSVEPAGTATPPDAGDADAEFTEQLLMALAGMAARSKRGQADLTAALRGAGIAAEPPRVRAALRLLHARGAVRNFVPLFDGGLLLSVISKVSEPSTEVSQWLPFEDEGVLAR
jgi:hypothetical protein